MLKDITLGQYFPGNSPIHRLDPRTKLIMLIVYIVALFSAGGWISYGIMLLFLAVVIKVSYVPLKAIVRGMKPLVLILIFTGILNLFFTGGETVLLSFWKINVTLEGAVRAFFMVTRILLMISGTFLLTYTTSPIMLTDGLESLMNPLKKLRFPVHELAMMMSIRTARWTSSTITGLLESTFQRLVKEELRRQVVTSWRLSTLVVALKLSL